MSQRFTLQLSNFFQEVPWGDISYLNVRNGKPRNVSLLSRSHAALLNLNICGLWILSTRVRKMFCMWTKVGKFCVQLKYQEIHLDAVDVNSSHQPEQPMTRNNGSCSVITLCSCRLLAPALGYCSVNSLSKIKSYIIGKVK